MAGTIGELTPLIGRMTVLWNDAQSVVYIMFDDMLGSDHERTKALFFALRSDGAQRYVTGALAHAVIKDETLLHDLNIEILALMRRIKDHLTQPMNALAFLSPHIPGLLAAPPPQQGVRTATAGLVPPPDDPEVPQPLPRSSEE